MASAPVTSRVVGRDHANPPPVASSPFHPRNTDPEGDSPHDPAGLLLDARRIRAATIVVALLALSMVVAARPAWSQPVPAGELSTLAAPGGAWALAELGVPPAVERASVLRVLVQRRYDASASVSHSARRRSPASRRSSIWPSGSSRPPGSPRRAGCCRSPR